MRGRPHPPARTSLREGITLRWCAGPEQHEHVVAVSEGHGYAARLRVERCDDPTIVFFAKVGRAATSRRLRASIPCVITCGRTRRRRSTKESLPGLPGMSSVMSAHAVSCWSAGTRSAAGLKDFRADLRPNGASRAAARAGRNLGCGLHLRISGHTVRTTVPGSTLHGDRRQKIIA
jgi:hypothetical protein